MDAAHKTSAFRVTMQKLRRYLRPTFSILCTIVCVLAMIWWVRSYWWLDLALGKHYSLMSLEGCILFGYSEEPTRPKVFLYSQNLNELREAGSIIHSGATAGFAYHRGAPAIQVGLPHWLFALVAGGMAAAPWLRWRFSLRAVLLATTLVAVGLGWIVYWANH